MESRRFEMAPHIGECGTCVLRHRHGAAGDRTVDVEHAEADTFHVEGADGDRERGAFFEKGLPGRARRLCLDHGHEGLQPFLGRLSGIGVGWHMAGEDGTTNG